MTLRQLQGELMEKSWRALALCSMLSFWSPSESVAERYALIVGATEYQVAAKLHGPKNDVVLIRDLLLDLGFASHHITILVEPSGVQRLEELGIDCHVNVGARCPTYGNILEHLNEFTHMVAPGDYFYIHFSGHGMKVPALGGEPSANGFDDVILPADLGNWDRKIGALENAIGVAQLRAFTDAVVAKGARAFFVVDACNSYPGLKSLEAFDVPDGADGNYANRGISPLSVRFRFDDYQRDELPDGVDFMGKFVFPESDEVRGDITVFHAAKYGQPAIEMNFPGRGGRPEDRLGVFTFAFEETVRRAMEDSKLPALTYRTLFDGIVQAYLRLGIANYAPSGSSLKSGEHPAFPLD